MECSSGLESYFDAVMLRSSPFVARAQLILAGELRGHSTQVVSQGRHHHSRWTQWAQPWSSGLNAPAGLPQNRHLDPRPRAVLDPSRHAGRGGVHSLQPGRAAHLGPAPPSSSRWIERPHPRPGQSACSRRFMPLRMAPGRSAVVAASTDCCCWPPANPGYPPAARGRNRAGAGRSASAARPGSANGLRLQVCGRAHPARTWESLLRSRWPAATATTRSTASSTEGGSRSKPLRS
jgi:hypothetical protein